MSVLDHQRLYIGLDVGSTTVKAVVVDPVADEILWQDYQRHDTKQPEKVLEFLTRIETEFPLPRERFRIFITGSGGSGLGPRIGRQVRPGSERGLAGRREALPRGGLGGRARRPGRQDHHLQGGPRDRQEEEDPVDERQVRRRHRRGDRQDQRQAADPARPALRHGLRRHQAAPGGRQVRRLRRDRHQRPAEDGRAAGRADGLAVRRHRRPEPVGADARQHAAPARAAARRPEHLHPRHGRGLAGTTSRSSGRSARSRCPRASTPRS